MDCTSWWYGNLFYKINLERLFEVAQAPSVAFISGKVVIGDHIKDSGEWRRSFSVGVIGRIWAWFLSNQYGWGTFVSIRSYRSAIYRLFTACYVPWLWCDFIFNTQKRQSRWYWWRRCSFSWACNWDNHGEWLVGSQTIITKVYCQIQLAT